MAPATIQVTGKWFGFRATGVITVGGCTAITSAENTAAIGTGSNTETTFTRIIVATVGTSTN